jgi:hypothetical protein
MVEMSCPNKETLPPQSFVITPFLMLALAPPLHKLDLEGDRDNQHSYNYQPPVPLQTKEYKKNPPFL